MTEATPEVIEAVTHAVLAVGAVGGVVGSFCWALFGAMVDRLVGGDDA